FRSSPLQKHASVTSSPDHGPLRTDSLRRRKPPAVDSCLRSLGPPRYEKTSGAPRRRRRAAPAALAFQWGSRPECTVTLQLTPLLLSQLPAASWKQNSSVPPSPAVSLAVHVPGGPSSIGTSRTFC